MEETLISWQFNYWAFILIAFH